jgi:hypothetical protein
MGPLPLPVAGVALLNDQLREFKVSLGLTVNVAVEFLNTGTYQVGGLPPSEIYVGDVKFRSPAKISLLKPTVKIIVNRIAAVFIVFSFVFLIIRHLPLLVIVE